MKQSSIRKTAILALSTITVFMTSCTNNPRKIEDKAVAAEINEQNQDPKYNQQDAQFLIEMAELNLEEIQLGQLAQKNGGSQEVRSLGKMMEDAHSHSFNDLTVLAQNKVVTIPTELNSNGSAFFTKMSAMKGKDFDKEYSAIMVEDHKKSIDLLGRIAAEANDQDIRQWASNTLPVLNEHLDHALMVQEQFK